MNLHVTSRLFLFAVLILCLSTSYSQSDRGLEIALEMKSRQKGYENYSVDMTMLLISSSGRETERKMRVITRESEGDGDQSLAVFDSPADVRGTGFLSHTHINRDDDQWLYLPALKRVKRISPQNKTAPFMGSEFSYEDLTSYEVENYSYQYIGEESLGGSDCYVLDRFPAYDFSGYNRQRVWVDKQNFTALKVDYYDHRNELKKTLRSTDFELHLGEFWYAHKMTMENYLSGKISELYWDNFKFREAIGANDFNPNSMTRLR